MRILLDFLPIALFFGAYKLQDIYVATAVLMAATVVQTAVIYAIDRKIATMQKATLGMILVIGLMAGAFCSAKWQGTFRWEGFKTTSDLVMHLLGGTLMGIGGVLAMGCTVGQGLSGLSTLSLGSFVAVFGIVLGGILALQWQMRRAESAS